jgi:hypothetical protein
VVSALAMTGCGVSWTASGVVASVLSFKFSQFLGPVGGRLAVGAGKAEPRRGAHAGAGGSGPPYRERPPYAPIPRGNQGFLKLCTKLTWTQALGWG